MKYKVGDKVRVRIDLVPCEEYGSLTFLDGNMSKCAGQICTIMKVVADKGYYVSENPFIWSEEMLEPVDGKTLRMADGTIIGEFNIGGFCDGFRGDKIPTPEKPASIEEQLGLPKGVSIHDLDMTSLYRPMNIEIQPLELVCNEKQAKELAERLNKELAGRFNAFPNDGISAKNGGKNTMKFTFYTEEGYRIDKSNNTRIPTMTTEVLINGKDYQYSGSATCDKADFDEREGVLNAIANAVCGGNFDREFNKVMKNKAFANKKSRTCTYCGKVFDTVEEKQAHEAWHVERRRARHERYLLRKRAKEIAFEEAAQKMAKEMIKEDK